MSSHHLNVTSTYTQIMLFPIPIPMTVYRTNKTSRESIRATCIWYISVPNSKNYSYTDTPKTCLWKEHRRLLHGITAPLLIKKFSLQIIFQWNVSIICDFALFNMVLPISMQCFGNHNLHVAPIYSYITTCMCHPSTHILQLACATHLLLYSTRKVEETKEIKK